MEIYDVVKKLVGEIHPIGETQTDNVRFQNLKVMTELVDKLLFDINQVAVCEKHSMQYSRQRAGKYADESMTRIGDEFNAKE